jgi:hypothetical protein
MNDKIKGKPGNYTVSKTGKSVRIVVRMQRALFKEFMSLCKRHRYDDARDRNVLVCAWLAGELRTHRTPAQIERERREDEAFKRRMEKKFGKGAMDNVFKVA